MPKQQLVAFILLRFRPTALIELMSETASSLMRLVVLMSATAAFAVVWSGDQQTQTQFLVAQKAAAKQARQTLLARQSHLRTLPKEELQDDRVAECRWEDGGQSVSTKLTSSPVARVEIEMELPPGIPSGRYQIVDEQGRLKTIHIFSEAEHVESPDIYILDRPDGSRQVFVRVSPIDEPMRADLPSIRR